MRSPLGTLVEKIGSLRNQVPAPYVGQRSMPTWTQQNSSDPAAQMAAMGSVGTLFSIVNRLSGDVAGVEWHMHQLAQRAPRTGTTCEVCDQPGVTLVTRHPALSVWNRPNDFFTRQEFVESEQQHVDLTGEGWWVIVYLGGVPIELWPVRPDRMIPVPHPTQFLSGYVYRAPDGEKIPLQLDEVIQIRMPNPLDPYRGMGPVQALLTQLDSIRFSAEWNRMFFLNSAEPGGIVQVEDGLEDHELRQMREHWNEQHRGVRNAHRVAILERGKWVERQFSMRDMQFVELSNASREQVREAFGIHKHQLGLADDVNRANAEASEYTHARHLIVPRLERIKQALNNDFLKLFGTSGKGYEFAYTSPVPEDRTANDAERTSKAQAYSLLVTSGVDPEDAASVCGLPPMRHTAQPAAVPALAGVGG